jgi:hypothetical protein
MQDHSMSSARSTAEQAFHEERPGWSELRAFLQAQLPGAIFGMCFEGCTCVDGPDGFTIHVPSEFAAGEARRSALALMEAWADVNDIPAVEVVVDTRLIEVRDTPDVDAPPLAVMPGPADTPVALVAQFAAERGFWALTPVGQQKVRVEERQGWLEIHPSKDYPVPGVQELHVFNAVTSLWAGGDRSTPHIEASVSEFARAMGVKRSGQNLAAIVSALESLKATSYKVQFLVRPPEGSPEDGPKTQRAILFSLIDELDTTWTGPPTSPNRSIRVRLSDQIFMLLRDNTRLLRRVDQKAMLALGPQRRFARRLLIFLDGAAAHRLPSQPGVELIERVIDERLAASLGNYAEHPDLYELKRSIELAAAAIIDVSSRYQRIEVVPRKKGNLRRGDPRYLLRVKRATLTPVAR